MKTKKTVNLNNHTITIIKIVTFVVIVIINLIILSPVYNNSNNTTFTIPTSPTVNTESFIKLDNIIKNKKFYSSQYSVVLPSLPNIFGP